MSDTVYDCPVCGWNGLENDPAKMTNEICPQCGVEFGVEEPENYPAIRAAWIAVGKPHWTKTHNQREMWVEIWESQ